MTSVAKRHFALIALLASLLAPRPAAAGEGPIVWFDPVANQAVDPELYDLEWNLSTEQEIKFGPASFKQGDLLLGFLKLSSLRPTPRGFGDTDVFVVRVPEALLDHGDLVAIDEAGKTLWRRSFSKADLWKWTKTLRELWQSTGSQKPPNSASFFWNSSFGELDGAQVFDELSRIKTEFRICWTYQTGELGTLICGSRYRFKPATPHSRLVKLKDDVPPFVHIDYAPVNFTGAIPVRAGQSVRFHARLRSGESLKFFARPRAPGVKDVAMHEDRFVRVRGTAPVPFGFTTFSDRSHTWYRDPEDEGQVLHWSLDLGDESPFIYTPGEGGGIFRTRIDFDHVPPVASRSQLSPDTPVSTYSAEPSIRGTRATGTELASDEWHISAGESADSFLWRFKADQGVGPNRAHLTILDNDKTHRYVAYYEIDRRYPFEISARLSGRIGNAQGMMLGEGAIGAWFEDIFGIGSYSLTQRRWGMNVRLTQALTPSSLDKPGGGKTDATFRSSAVDIRYRFWPGTWGHDDTTGVLISSHQVAYGFAEANLAGVGFFWARSMPTVIDRILRLLPPLRSPKWLDFDAVYFPVSVTSGVEAKQTWIVSAHAKIFWSERFFGELGAGLNHYRFDKAADKSGLDYSSAFGTLGIGVNL